MAVIFTSSIYAEKEVIKFESLKTKSGKIYNSVIVREKTFAGIKIFHEGGATTIFFQDLPDEVIKKLDGKTTKALPTGVPNISKILGYPIKGVNEILGKPYLVSKSKTSGNWVVNGWHVTILIKKKKCAKCIIGRNDPNDKNKFQTLKEACETFGFTKENGWSIGPMRKQGIIKKVVYLTHKTKGVCKAFYMIEKDGFFKDVFFYSASITSSKKMTSVIDSPETEKMISKQFHPWDGSHIRLVKYIKKNMLDPSSFQHVSSKYKVINNHLIVTTTFRGKNSFGGVAISSMKAKVSIDGVNMTILQTEP